jgi:hypothetical protein
MLTLQFYVQSAKTKQFLYESIEMRNGSSPDRAVWTLNMSEAKMFETPKDAISTVSRLSVSARTRIIMWDGIALWQVSVLKSND